MLPVLLCPHYKWLWVSSFLQLFLILFIQYSHIFRSVLMLGPPTVQDIMQFVLLLPFLVSLLQQNQKYINWFKWTVIYIKHLNYFLGLAYIVKMLVFLVRSGNTPSYTTTFLKGSYDVAKKNSIWCIWCNAMCLCGLRLKKVVSTANFHILYIIVAPLSSAFLKCEHF